MIKAKRIYEPTPKKEEQIDLQKIIADAFQSSISKAEKVSTWVSLEIEKENKIIERIMYKIEDKIKSMKIDKSGVTEDVYNQLSSSLKSLWEYLLNIVNNHEHDYLTSEDKDECISIAETMVNEAVLKFDNLIKPFSDKFLRDLESKADKEHSHDELDEIMKDIEENEEELERKLETKADKEHKHEIEDVTWLSETLKGFANKEHKHDQYATVEQLNMVSMHRSRWAGWWGHVIQTSGVVLAQRSNMNFIWATVTDDPNNNATVVTITWWSGSWDVVWPASATDWNIALYDWATGKLIKNSTYSPASFAPALTSDENYVTDAEKIIISATTASYTTADETKVDFITVTQAVNLDTMESDIAALANGMVYKWNWDASAWTFPWGWTAQTWRFYTVSVGGTVDSVVFAVDDRLVATTDNASTTIYAWNWTKLDATDAVTSVNGQTWNVTWLQEIATVISWNTTASNDWVYVVVASATFTDPSPVEWKWYKVIVRNGTATVWWTGYAVAWSEILRIYHSWAWANYLKTPSSWVNTWDQTSIVGITGTLAEFNTALTDWDFATLAWTETLSNKTLSWATVLEENASLQLDWVLSADGKWSWTTITWTAWYTQAFWDLVTLDKDDSRREAVDISVAAAATWDARGLLWMVISAWTDGTACTILLQGTIRADANFPALTIWAPVYASTTWDIVVTQPSTTDYVIRIIWSALTADSIYFSPWVTWITHT